MTKTTKLASVVLLGILSSKRDNPEIQKAGPVKKGSIELDLDQVLDQQVRVRLPGGSKNMDAREATLRVQVDKALKGNIQSARYVLKQFEKYEAITPPRSKIQTGVVIAPRAPVQEHENDT